MSKKVLIITYYWPPAGGPGVQRWLKFVKYLPENGFAPVVYCPENPNYPIIDSNITEPLHENVTVLKRPILEPYKLAGIFSKKGTNRISSGIITDSKKQSIIERLLLYVRGNFFIPDARKYWVKPSVKFLESYIKDHKIETVVTTGPPHSMHLIGLELKKRCDIKWLTDFRDPWTTIGYHSKLKLTKQSIQKHKALEQDVLRSTDQVIVTSQNTKKAFQQLTSKPIAVITNGYDTQTVSNSKRKSNYTIAHIGSLLSGRNPENLWKAIMWLLDENPELKSNFNLDFYGVVSDSVLESIYASGLEPYVCLKGYVDHDKAVLAQKESHLLLLIEIDSEETKVIIPGKLFEYMISNTPILAVGPQDSDVENIVISTNTGRYCDYEALEAMKLTLEYNYQQYKLGVIKTAPIGLNKFSRSALTKELTKYL